MTVPSPILKLSLLACIFSGLILGCNCVEQPPTGDTTRPTVISITPLDGATNATPDTVIVVTFSEPVSIVGTSPALRRDGTFSIAVTQSMDVDNVTLTLTPTQPLNEGDNLTLTIGTDYKDFAGNNLEATFTSDFTVATIVPEIISTVPANSATNVAANATIVVNFSKAMDQVGSYATLTPGGLADLNWLSATSVEIVPFANMPNCTAVTVDLDGFEDLNGIDLVGPTSISFTTVISPVVAVGPNTDPDDGTTEWCVFSGIVIPFTGALDPLSGGTYSVTENSVALDTSGWIDSWNITKTIFNLVPNNVVQGKNYVLTVTGFKDSCGFGFTGDPIVINFSTIFSPPLQTPTLGSKVVLASPASYSAAGNGMYIAYMNTDGTGITLPANMQVSPAQYTAGQRVRYPTISPDGNWIVYVRDDGTTDHLNKYHIPTSTNTDLGTSSTFGGSAISSDNATLLYLTVNPSYQTQLSSIPMAAANLTGAAMIIPGFAGIYLSGLTASRTTNRYMINKQTLSFGATYTMVTTTLTDSIGGSGPAIIYQFSDSAPAGTNLDTSFPNLAWNPAGDAFVNTPFQAEMNMSTFTYENVFYPGLFIKPWNDYGSPSSHGTPLSTTPALTQPGIMQWDGYSKFLVASNLGWPQNYLTASFWYVDASTGNAVQVPSCFVNASGLAAGIDNNRIRYTANPSDLSNLAFVPYR